MGLLVLAKRPVTRAGWVCMVLDAWLIGGSLLTLSWSLALAQAARFDGPSVAHAALSLAYPLLDIALVSMVLALHFRRSTVNRSAVNTAIGALALTVGCDALFTSPLMHNNYHSGQLLDAGWFAGSLLLAYAPWVGPATPAHARGARPPPGTRRDPARADAAQAQASGQPAHHRLAGRAHPVPGRRRVHAGHPLQRPQRPQPRPRGAHHRGPVVLALVVRQGIMLLDNITLTQELAQKENHFRSLVQGSSDVIMIAAPNGMLRYVSPAAAGVYGRSAEDLVGTELAHLIHPEDLGCVVHEVRRFLAASPRRRTHHPDRVPLQVRLGAVAAG